MLGALVAGFPVSDSAQRCLPVVGAASVVCRRLAHRRICCPDKCNLEFVHKHSSQNTCITGQQHATHKHTYRDRWRIETLCVHSICSSLSAAASAAFAPCHLHVIHVHASNANAIAAICILRRRCRYAQHRRFPVPPMHDVRPPCANPLPRTRIVRCIGDDALNINSQLAFTSRYIAVVRFWASTPPKAQVAVHDLPLCQRNKTLHQFVRWPLIQFAARRVVFVDAVVVVVVVLVVGIQLCW